MITFDFKGETYGIDTQDRVDDVPGNLQMILVKDGDILVTGQAWTLATMNILGVKQIASGFIGRIKTFLESIGQDPDGPFTGDPRIDAQAEEQWNLVFEEIQKQLPAMLGELNA